MFVRVFEGELWLYHIIFTLLVGQHVGTHWHTFLGHQALSSYTAQLSPDVIVEESPCPQEYVFMVHVCKHGVTRPKFTATIMFVWLLEGCIRPDVVPLFHPPSLIANYNLIYIDFACIDAGIQWHQSHSLQKDTSHSKIGYSNHWHHMMLMIWIQMSIFFSHCSEPSGF